jgi:methyl-accepting chemotaxis protein
MQKRTEKDYSRKWGLRRFRMRAKLLLSIGVLGFGYLLFLGLVQWTASSMQHHLRTASDSLFPAALAAQQAEAGFLKLTKDYKDAVVMQDSSALSLADEDALKVAVELQTFQANTLDNAELQHKAVPLQAAFADFSRNSRAAYAQMLGTPAAMNADLLVTIKMLAAENESIAVSLKDLDELVSEKYFQAELNAVAATINRQRYLTWILFIVVFAFATFTSRILEREISVPLGRAVEALDCVADGDLTVVLYVQGQDEVGLMGGALNRAIARIRSTLQEVTGSAGAAGTFSEELIVVAGTIASGAQKQAGSLATTTATLEQITSAARQNAGSAKEASRLASSSRDAAERGQEVVAKAIAAMGEINSASAKISDIISNIDEIAFQTNLLAVNAAVEAARAGDEGRGFAVVASEVRALAQRSAAAAKEIKSLIQDSLRKVERGSAMVNQSGETLQTIFSSVKMVTDIVGEIAAASEEQRTGIEQVNVAMSQVDHVTQSNLAQTEVLSSKLQSLGEQSVRLMELFSTFTLGDAAEDDECEGSSISSAEPRDIPYEGDTVRDGAGEAFHWNHASVDPDKGWARAVAPTRGNSSAKPASRDFSSSLRKVNAASFALVSTGPGGVITRNQVMPAENDEDTFEEF